MGTVAVVTLAAAAGMNPWLTLLMVVGLATFTSRVPIAPRWETAQNGWTVAAMAVLLGLEIVGLKVKQTARWIAILDAVAAPAAGAALCLGLRNPLLEASDVAAALVGAVVALLLRGVVRLAGRALQQPLKPFGRVAAGMVANVIAAVTVAGVFAIGSAAG